MLDIEAISLPGDSEDYHILTEAARMAPAGLTCEIGLRRGGGSRAIMDGLSEGRTHIAVDPYGNISYRHSDNVVGTMDYTNAMRDECMINIYRYASQKRINFLFFNMEDGEFFERYRDGVPVYSDGKVIESRYGLVHFDGPHGVNEVMSEIYFFHDRVTCGSVFVFDDVEKYDHVRVDVWLKNNGWKEWQRTARRVGYTRA